MREKNIKIEVFQYRGSHWNVQMHFGSISIPFARGSTALEAIADAQDRAVELARGLTDIENTFRNVKHIKI